MSKPKSKLLVGGHVNGGLKSAPKKAKEIGAECIQIFIGSPQSWMSPHPSEADFESFRVNVEENKLGPVFVHGNYLVNLASPEEEKLERSILNLSIGLRLADRAGAKGLIFHPGSTRDEPYEEAISRVVSSINEVMKDYTGDCLLILETCAGSGNTIGCKFSQLKDIIDGVDDSSKIGVCWDTCHLYSAGYDIKSEAGLNATLAEFDSMVGRDRLVAIHANDSKTPFNSKRDRHENIGQGSLGEETFSNMLRIPTLRNLPWLLEVPGFERKGPDRKNMDILRRLATEAEKKPSSRRNSK